MRIGIYDPYLDDLGGGEKYMMTIAECLSQDNEVDIFWDNKEDIKSLLQRFPLNLSKVNIVENIFSTKTSKLKRILRTKKYDVIIFLSDGSMPFVLSKKLFIHIQQPLDHFQSKGFFNKIKLLRVNAFFVNSNYTKVSVEEKYFVKARVIYPPVDFKTKNIKKENIILHVGRFRPRNVKIDDFKKQAFMINVFKELVGGGLKNWKFVLAVSVNDKDKHDFEEMKKTAEGFPIEFLLNKSNDQLWEIYSKAKIYWHASGFGEDLKAHPDLAEHFGISTVEAMGAGAVPVVFNAGGQKEIVETGLNGFTWNLAEELKENTLELIRNENVLEKLSDRAVKDSQKFTKEKFCKEIHDLIA